MHPSKNKNKNKQKTPKHAPPQALLESLWLGAVRAGDPGKDGGAGRAGEPRRRGKRLLPGPGGYLRGQPCQQGPRGPARPRERQAAHPEHPSQASAVAARPRRLRPPPAAETLQPAGPGVSLPEELGSSLDGPRLSPASRPPAAGRGHAAPCAGGEIGKDTGVLFHFRACLLAP